jgi:hypothetical protein
MLTHCVCGDVRIKVADVHCETMVHKGPLLWVRGIELGIALAILLANILQNCDAMKIIITFLHGNIGLRNLYLSLR